MYTIEHIQDTNRQGNGSKMVVPEHTEKRIYQNAKTNHGFRMDNNKLL